MWCFGKEEVNTGRQIEFDIAKTVCILGMVLVHCFEEFAAPSTVAESPAYFILVVVLDCLFGAATFMSCMGIGTAYSRSQTPQFLIRRGATIFLYAYLLNFARDLLPELLNVLSGKLPWRIIWPYFFYVDIMQFAGLALITLGLLRKWKLSPFAILGVAAGMSLLGSFLRGLDLHHVLPDQLVGLFFGTFSPAFMAETMTAFPLFNWFLFVAGGYVYGLFLRRCTDLRRYYRVATPIAAAILILYMAIAIPNRIGMMSGDLNLYYHLTLPEVLISFVGMIFITGVYHFFSQLLGDTARRLVLRISSNINRIYCIHWVIIGWIYALLVFFGFNGLPPLPLLGIGCLIFLAATVLAEIYTRFLEKRKQKNTH